MIKERTTWEVIKEGGEGGWLVVGEKNKIKLQGKCPPKKYMQSKTQGVGGDVPSAWTREEKITLETDWNRLKKSILRYVTMQLINTADFLAPTFLKQIIKTSENFFGIDLHQTF